MITKKIMLINQLGLHARAAAKFVNHASRFLSTITVKKDNKIINGKSIMGIMMLAAPYGTILEITIDGKDEFEMMNDLEVLINKKFGEPS